MPAAHTPLFVPGNRPDRFEKARCSGSSHVIIDLEDSVPGDAKRAARAAAASWPWTHRCGVRVNAIGTEESVADLAWLADLRPENRPRWVMVPKLETVEQIDRVVDGAGDLEIIGLIESARGIESAAALAAHRGLVRFAFGVEDFILDVQAARDSVTTATARARLVCVSRAFGLPAPWDGPTLDLRDSEKLRAAGLRAKAEGFAGTLCIHPAQVADIQRGYLPTPAEIEWARRLVAHREGVTALDGAMVDLPVARRAARILRDAADASSDG